MSKRQFCRKGIHTCIPAVTLEFEPMADGTPRRLHWCADHAADAELYRDQAIAGDELSVGDVSVLLVGLQMLRDTGDQRMTPTQYDALAARPVGTGRKPTTRPATKCAGSAAS